MCSRILVEHKCKHRVYRGSTRCFNENCGEKKEVINYDADICPQCEASKRWLSARWCPEGGCCTVM